MKTSKRSQIYLGAWVMAIGWGLIAFSFEVSADVFLKNLNVIELTLGLGDREVIQLEAPLREVQIDRTELDGLKGAEVVRMNPVVEGDFEPQSVVTALELISEVSSPSFSSIPIRIQGLSAQGVFEEFVLLLNVVPELTIQTGATFVGDRVQIWWAFGEGDSEQEIGHKIELRQHEDPIILRFVNKTDFDRTAHRGIRIHGEGLIPHGSFSVPEHTLFDAGQEYRVTIESKTPSRGIYRCHNYESGSDNKEIWFNQDLE